MKKVICVNPGKQVDGLNVIVGNTYTVIGTATGGEVGMYHRAYDIFYVLAEMGNERCFWDGLFADLPEDEILETKEEQCATSSNQ